MPLPPAPTQRAALVSPEAYDAPARSHSKGARKPTGRSATFEDESSSHQPQALDLFDRSGGGRSASDHVDSDTTALLEDVASKSKTRTPSSTSNQTGSSYKHSSYEAAQAKPKKSKPTGPTKLFVLDTNVLMHDPMSLFRFEEHDIFLPMIVLEELDGHKKGMTEVARNARQVSRTLDALAAAQGADMAKGLKLDATGHKTAGGRLFFQTQPLSYTLPISLPQGKADNQILGVVGALGESKKPQEVVLVSKDINMRVKARALGLPTDDYQNDKTLEDGDLLYTGAMALPHDFWDKHGKTVESWQQGGHTFYRVTGPSVPNMLINQFVYFEAPGEPTLFARVTEIRDRTAVLKTLKDYGHAKNAVWGVTTRNREQTFGHLGGHRRHWKNFDGIGGGFDASARRAPLQRDHHDARHRQRRRRHWFFTRHRRGKNGPVDGCVGRQP
jgi:PhoH-like ATPase